MSVDASDQPSTTAAGALRTVLRRRRLIGLDLRLLALVAVLAAASGFLQAAVLLIVVRVATALTASTELVSGSVGPFSASDLTVAELIVLAAVLVAVLLAVDTANAWGQASLQSRSQRGARRRMLEAYTAAPYPQQLALPRGEMQQVLNALPNQVSSVSEQLGVAVSSGLSFVVLAGSAFLLSPAAAGTVAVGVLVMLLILRPVVAAGRRAGDRHIRAQRALGGRVGERLELAGEVQAFGVGAPASAIVDDQIVLVAERLRRLRFLSRMSSVVYRIGALALVLVMMALVDSADSTNLAALGGAMIMLLRSMSYGQSVQSAYQSINEASPVVRQLVEEQQRLAAPSDRSQATEVPDAFGSLALHDVTYTYPDGTAVLPGTDLVIDPGDFVALVGPSGSGKSTVMALLLGIRTPTTGHLTLGGLDTSRIDPDWWHRNVAYVPQESRLQAGPVREAIRFHRAWVDDAAIEEAGRLARIDEDIRGWDGGYDAEVGQAGDRVSGGQRQRLALARAFAGRPKLLLLDEPTSALDPSSEVLIREALESIRHETTIVVIAHRPETVRNASRIIRVDGGVLREVTGDIEEALRGVHDT